MSMLAMTPRLDVERRLLAALFLYPRTVTLEPRHFLAPAHGALFDALEEVQRHFPVEVPDWQGHFWDDVGLALVVWTLGRDKKLGLFLCVGGVENFVVNDLARLPVMSDAIPDLVEQVRACPRCGR